MATDDPQLKVDAHVLVQLGSELVTDVEQAISDTTGSSRDTDANTADLWRGKFCGDGS